MKKMVILNAKEFDVMCNYILDIEFLEETYEGLKGADFEDGEPCGFNYLEKAQDKEVQDYVMQLTSNNNDDIIEHVYRDNSDNIVTDYILVLSKKDMSLLSGLMTAFVEIVLPGLPEMYTSDEERKLIYAVNNKLDVASW